MRRANEVQIRILRFLSNGSARVLIAGGPLLRAFQAPALVAGAPADFDPCGDTGGGRTLSTTVLRPP